MQLSFVQVGAPSLLPVSYLECSFTDAAPYIHRREGDQGGHPLVRDLIAGVLPMCIWQSPGLCLLPCPSFGFKEVVEASLSCLLCAAGELPPLSWASLEP